MFHSRTSRQQVAIYLLLVFLFSSIFYFLMLRAHALDGGSGLYVTGIMWCPALAGMLTLKLNGRRLSELGWRWPGTMFATMSWYVPLLYAAIAYAIVWTLRLGAFPNNEFMQGLVGRMGLHLSPALSTVAYVLLMGSFGLVGSLSRALGEEIGWRGFLVPEMSKTMSFTTTALISGIVWSLWHYPILIWGDYNAGTATWYALTCFTVMVVAISFVFAWIRLKSGSLWTAAMLHASHNLYIQSIFTPLTRDTGQNRLVYRRIRRRAAYGGGAVRDLLLAQAERSHSTIRDRAGAIGCPSQCINRPALILTLNPRLIPAKRGSIYIYRYHKMYVCQ